MTFWEMWRRQGHWTLAWAIAFCTVAALVNGTPWWLGFIVVALGADVQRARESWRKRQAALKKYQMPQPTLPQPTSRK